MKMKYSSPTLEIVSFGVLDSPRIGMQWWWHNDDGMGWEPAPAGYSIGNHPANNGPIPIQGPGCNSDSFPSGNYWICYNENLPATTNSVVDCGQDSIYSGHQVVDDGKSC